MRFDPKASKYPYPLYTDQHYIVVKKDDGTIFDEHYPYVDRSRGFRCKRFLTRVLLRLIVFPLAKVKLGLRTKGRENLKKYKDVLKNGAISCSNHVHFWDYICVMRTLRPRRPYVLSWAKNVSGESGKLVRLVGGVPLPEKNAHAAAACLHAVRNELEAGGWLHVYAEGSMWEYYAPIRPFKGGVGYFACQCDKPILPMAFSYRKPGWLRAKVFGQLACFTLTVGEPLFADPALPRKARERDLVRRCHEAVCRLAGIDPAENPYPPIFDHTKRADAAPDAVSEEQVS